MSDRSNPATEPLASNNTSDVTPKPVIPVGFCQCGCGGRTELAKRTRCERGDIAGQPLRFCHWHHSRPKEPRVLSPKSIEYMANTPPPNPSGLCLCGCEGVTAIAKSNCPRFGWVKGEHKRYLSGHHKYKSLAEYEVRDCGYKTPCWVWLRYTSPEGYGLGTDDNKEQRSAHIIYYERAKGLVPKGLELDHLCRNPSCVNPDHLEAVTRAVNTQRGLAAKLTEEKVLQMIQARREGKTYREIGRMFGTSKDYAFSVLKGEHWKHLTAPSISQ